MQFFELLMLMAMEAGKGNPQAIAAIAAPTLFFIGLGVVAVIEYRDSKKDSRFK